MAHFRAHAPAKLVVTEDDKYGDAKRALCAEVGAEYIVLPKSLDTLTAPISTTQARRRGVGGEGAGGWCALHLVLAR